MPARPDMKDRLRKLEKKATAIKRMPSEVMGLVASN